MTDHSQLLDQYRRAREVRFRLNNLLVTTIPKETLKDCGRKLGFFRKGTMFFETEDETSVLMDYCIYQPGPDGRNLVAKYLETSPPPADSEEMVALQTMTRAYYSLFQVVEVERGIGVSVRDVLRNEMGFIVDVGFGNTTHRHGVLATRIIPMDDFLMTGGAALPVDPSAASRIVKELTQANLHPGTFDFKQITPRQEADLAALIIRACRSTGMTSRISYAEPGSAGMTSRISYAEPGSAGMTSRISYGEPGSPAGRPMPHGLEGRRIGRNEPCPCGSGKKFKVCCGRA